MSAIWKLMLAFVLGLLMCEFVSASDPYWHRPIYVWGNPWRATTPVESIMRGQAALLEANGQASLYDSLAAKNYQDAYKQSLENRMLRTEVYFTRKEMAKEYALKYAEKPRDAEDVKRLAKLAAPKRLSPEQFDPLTTQLTWPHVLRRGEYEAVRQKIDTLMSVRTPDDSGDGSPTHTKIRQMVELMKMLLKENMETVTPQQYADAKAFLVSLEYEARQPLRE
jgi:hypothetical protein